MGCQKNIAKEIVENESNYILVVKQNQDELLQQAIKMFEINKAASTNETTDLGHGRIETRKCTVVNNLNFMDVAQDWTGLQSVVKIDTVRTIKLTGKTETNTRYYISSLNTDASTFNTHIRNHWAIENNLHWVLDEVFCEDKSRRRIGSFPENFSIIAKTALVLLKKATYKTKHNLSTARTIAGWNTEFRESMFELGV